LVTNACAQAIDAGVVVAQPGSGGSGTSIGVVDGGTTASTQGSAITQSVGATVIDIPAAGDENARRR